VSSRHQAREDPRHRRAPTLARKCRSRVRLGESSKHWSNGPIGARMRTYGCARDSPTSSGKVR
jgi:hypothetical protein